MAMKHKRLRGRILRWLLIPALLVSAISILLILPLRWLDPPTTAFILRAEREGQQVEQEWAPWEELGRALPIAVVASEDQKFPVHDGFDLVSMREALAGGAGRGASTISQQVVKNLYLWPGRSWLRKGIEGWLTIILEAVLPKRRILEIYLNIAQFGPAIYGARAATQHYFGREPDRISPDEAARLATVLPSPTRIDPRHRSPYVDERAAWIMTQVRGLGGAAYLEGLD
jgi:monofunctional biosynthetic peptidoglycan transglycosylase